MGASFVTTRLGADDKAQAKAAFERLQDKDRYDNGHSYSGGFGMVIGLKFTFETFADERVAHEWLANHAGKWDYALAVKITGKPGWYIGAWCAS